MSQVILPLLYTGLLVLMVQRLNFFHLEGIPRKWLIGVFLLKVIAGTALWYVYTHIYTDRLTADIFKYFDDGLVMYNALFSDPVAYFKMLLGIPDPALDHYLLDDMRHWTREFGAGLYNENRTLIRFNALADILSGGNYHVHTVFLCFLSLTGLTGIYKSFLSSLKNRWRELFAAVFLLPSVLFWGSGVLKEGLVLFALGMCIFCFFKLVREKITWKGILMTGLFLLLLAASKFYVFLVLVPSLISYAWVTLTNNKLPAVKYGIVLLLFISAGLNVPGYDFPYMLMDKQAQAIYMARGGSYLGNKTENKFVYIGPEVEDRIIRLRDKPGYCRIVPGIPYISWNLDSDRDSVYVKSATDTLTYWIYNDGPAAGSLIEVPFLEANIGSIAKTAPLAFFNVLFRPVLPSGKNPLMLLAAVENLAISAFMLVCMLFYTRKNKNTNLLLFCICFVVLLFVLIGLTTPVLGAIVRYKVPALLFLPIIFLLLLDKERLLQKMPYLQRWLN